LHLEQVHGIIFVVDAANQERFEEAKETLALTLASEGIAGKPVLVFANKQDLDGCISAADLSREMGLLERRDCRHSVHACTAKPPEGQPVDVRIGKALKWLLDAVDSDYEKLNTRVVAEKAERDRIENERRAAQRKRAEESKALRLKEQAEADLLKREQEEHKGEAGTEVEMAAGAHASSDQSKPAANQAWGAEIKQPDASASTRAPADIGSGTPRNDDSALPNQSSAAEGKAQNCTPVRNAASLGQSAVYETPGKEEVPRSDTPVIRATNKLPALEVNESLQTRTGSPAPVGGKPKLGALKPMPPPIKQPEPTLPNAMPSPVPESKSGTSGADF
jgi:ADP-ribosylation factor-like protein 13B